MKAHLLALTASIALLCMTTSAVADGLSATLLRGLPATSVFEAVAANSEGTLRWYSLPKESASNSIHDIAQTFTAPNDNEAPLTGIALQIAPGAESVGHGAQQATCIVSIYATDSPEKASKRNRIYSQTTRLPGQMTDENFLVFDLGQKVKLKEGKRYTITFQFESRGAKQSIRLIAGTEGSYPTGRAYFFTTTHRDQQSPRWEASRENLQMHLLTR